MREGVMDSIKSACVVAGNGPSLAEIDYARLPKDFDVFRCNQFYFEDKYYLGKEVKLAFANPFVLFEQLYTLWMLENVGDYHIDAMMASTFNLKYMDSNCVVSPDIFGDVLDGHNYVARLRKFDEFMRYNELFLDRRITSGIYMCAVAVALGYEEIYLTGLDLYEGSKLYGFDFLQENIVRLVPGFGGEGRPNVFHSKEIDLEALDLLARLYGAKFFCISPSSPLCKYLPLAKTQGFHENWILESKSEGYINDVLIPEDMAYGKRNSQMPSGRGCISPRRGKRAAYEGHKAGLKNNLFYSLVKDFFRLPKDIFNYLRGKLLIAIWERENRLANENAAIDGGGGGQCKAAVQNGTKSPVKGKAHTSNQAKQNQKSLQVPNPP